MTPEAQRIAIAEACGWTIETNAYFKVLYPPGLKHYGQCCGLHLTEQEVWQSGLIGDENGECCFPNYPSDLNAMHEAETLLTPQQKWEFILRLICQQTDSNISSNDWLKLKHGQFKPPGMFPAVFATAAQRAEALLKTLNLWKP